MEYNPRSPPPINNLEELQKWVEDELRLLALALAETTALDLRPINAAPTRPRDGMIVYADGVNFNPGAGAGTYERRAGAWVKL